MASCAEETSVDGVETVNSVVAAQEPDLPGDKEVTESKDVTNVSAEQSAELAVSVESKASENLTPVQETAKAQTAEDNVESGSPEAAEQAKDEVTDETKQEETAPEIGAEAIPSKPAKEVENTTSEAVVPSKELPCEPPEEVKQETPQSKIQAASSETSPTSKKPASNTSGSIQKQKNIGSLQELDSRWQAQENPCEHHLVLSPEFARPLLRVPHIEGKGSFMAAWRLAAVASDVNWDIRDASTGSPQCVQINLRSRSAEAMQRARKYMRLILSADRGWIKINPATADNSDLTLLTCPEDLWSWVLGKQDSNLLSAADESGVLIFCIGEYRKLGSDSQNEQVNPWLRVGMSVEVKSKGDVRNISWTIGTVTEILRSRSIRVSTSRGGAKVESTVEPSSYRPIFNEGDAVEVCVDGDWKSAKFKCRGEGDSVVAERSGSAKEFPTSAIRPARSSPGGDEPIFQLAIFGGLRGRCGALLRFMSAVDWKRPGYYSGQLDLSIPSGVDWKYEKVQLAQEEVSKCIGTKGDIRRALCRAAECVIDYLGPVAYVCGAKENCFFATSLLEIVRTSKKGEIEGIPEGVEDFCDAVNIPFWVVQNIHGKGRKTVEQIEQSEGVMMFVFKPPGMEEEPEPNDATHMFIFACSQRARQRANIRLIQAVRQHIDTYGALEPQLNDEEGVFEDVILFKGEELAACQSKERERKVIEKASGCAIEVFGKCVHLVGTLEDRTRARLYMKWLFLHIRARDKEARAIPLSSEDLIGRDDLTEIMLTGAEQKKLLAAGRQTLDEVEDLSGTFIFFREVSRDELLVAGRVGEIIIAGRSFRVQLLGEPNDASELSVRLCKEGEEDSHASNVALLIWGHDSGIGAKTGRALAVQKVRQFLCGNKSSKAASTTVQATSSERKDDEGSKQSKGKGAGKKKKDTDANWDNDEYEADWDQWGGNANGSKKKQNDDNDVWSKWGGGTSDTGSRGKQQTDEWNAWPAKGGHKSSKKQDYWEAEDNSTDGWNKWKGAKNEWANW